MKGESAECVPFQGTGSKAQELLPELCPAAYRPPNKTRTATMKVARGHFSLRFSKDQPSNRLPATTSTCSISFQFSERFMRKSA